MFNYVYIYQAKFFRVYKSHLYTSKQKLKTWEVVQGKSLVLLQIKRFAYFMFIFFNLNKKIY
jgi:hypothetical protein